MSIDHIVWVLKHSNAEGGARLVMIVLADHANDEDVAYPSVTTIAKKARLSPRQVRRLLKILCDLGELVELSDPSAYQTKRYKLAMGGDIMSGGDIGDRGGVTSATEKVPLVSPEPTTEPTTQPINGRAQEGKLFDSPDPEARIMAHYQASHPGAGRFKLDQSHRVLIRKALKVRDEATIRNAIDGIVRDPWWLQRFPDGIELRHALKGNVAKGESDQARIDKMASKADSSYEPSIVQSILDTVPSARREMVAGKMNDVRRMHNPAANDLERKIGSAALEWLLADGVAVDDVSADGTVTWRRV